MRWLLRAGALLCSILVATGLAQRGQFDRSEVNPHDEAIVFTPAGFDRPGVPRSVSPAEAATLVVRVVDVATRQPIPCRLNVVGPDGNFYQPTTNALSSFSLIGRWPDTGAGNREGKAPIRYFGRFFYTTGGCQVRVPPGECRIEASRGLEYAPVTVTVHASTEHTTNVLIELKQTIDAREFGYYSGDPHLHFPRLSDADDDPIFALLSAELVRFGIVMCYNETDAYAGSMSTLVMPQRRLGRSSLAVRDGYHLISGQEYRNGVYGHINLFLRDRLVLEGESLDPNRWPVFGIVGAETLQHGGYAIHAHGGYAQEIYSDVVQRATTGVELLQFGIYRGIGLAGWYHILNAGYRFPAVGASDYPACRKLSDCQTFVQIDGEPTFERWLDGMARGRSFVTTGPILLLTVDDQSPGGRIDRSGNGPHMLTARIRVRSEAAPVTHVQLVVNGQVVEELVVDCQKGHGQWLQITKELTVCESSWIAARAFSVSATGSPDAESHTNPVFVYLNGRAPYREADLDWLAAQITTFVADQQARNFPEREQVVAYHQQSLQSVQEIRRAGGQPAPDKP
jgi:hypothetical protein